MTGMTGVRNGIFGFSIFGLNPTSHFLCRRVPGRDNKGVRLELQMKLPEVPGQFQLPGSHNIGQHHVRVGMLSMH